MLHRIALDAVPLIEVFASIRERSPDALARKAARCQEPAWVDGIRCRCPPVKKRVPFVCGYTPEDAGPSHETGRVRLLTQRMALTMAWPACSPQVD